MSKRIGWFCGLLSNTFELGTGLRLRARLGLRRNNRLYLNPNPNPNPNLNLNLNPSNNVLSFNPLSAGGGLVYGLLALSLCAPLRAGTLEDYVRKPDDSFAWSVREKSVMSGLDVVTLDLTSQTWHSNRWTHTLYIATPRNLRHPETAMLQITGSAGKDHVATVKLLAERSGARVAVLTGVPNQPLFDNRFEDSLIAFTFDRYLKTGDDSWPLLLPMAKSAVRAMDAVQAWAEREQQPKIGRFVVTGASKRGWTTWLTGAVDPRVCAIAPVVIDMLNMKAQTQWAQRVYGQQSEKIKDYTELGLVEKMDLPEMAKLRGIVDPYSYRAAFTMPKLLLLGTNDPYWTVDALRHYWADLPDPKAVYQAPNAGHGAGGTRESLQTLAAFLQLVAENRKPPQITWEMKGSGGASVTAFASQPAHEALLWTAHADTRDFRKAKWSSRPLELDPARTRVSAAVATPTNGFTAFLVELAFTTPAKSDYRLSTQVQVTPDL